MCDIEKLLSQLEELKLDSRLLNHTFIDVVTFEKSTLELCEKVDSINFINSSVCEYEDVNNNAIHELGRIGPHSNHFFILCLDSKILIDSFEPMEECKEEENIFIFLNVLCQTKNLHSSLKGQEFQHATSIAWFLYFYTTAP